MVKTSVRALLSVAVTGREKGLTEIGISRTISPRWNVASWSNGAEILLRICSTASVLADACRHGGVPVEPAVRTTA